MIFSALRLDTESLGSNVVCFGWVQSSKVQPSIDVIDMSQDAGFGCDGPRPEELRFQKYTA